jgi:branched-chain amino acid transport system substrate-binding protein
MNRKVALILIPLLLAPMFALAPLTSAQPTIKIGIIGPVGLPHWEPAGMKPAAELAAKEINDAGGVNVGGIRYSIELLFENEWAIDPNTGSPNPTMAVEAVTNLLQQGAQFIIGGFRTEVTDPIIETVMDWNEDPSHTPVLFFIDGASTDWLCRDLTKPENYTRYKWVFRVMPTNSTALFSTFCAYIRYYLVQKLLKMYGNPVKFAVLLEDLEWTLPMVGPLTVYYPYVLGPNVTLVYYARVPETATDFSTWLTAVKNSGARLMLFVFSGRPGNPLIKQWRELEVPAIPVGINVLGQLQQHWALTEGKCEYEIILNYAGTRTPIVPGYSEVFWDNFLAYTKAKYGAECWPIYTAAGAYNAIYTIKEAIEATGSLNPATIVNYLETHESTPITGQFKFTTNHDIYSVDYGPLWPTLPGKQYGYVRAFVVQWIAGIMNVVSPIDKPYSKKTKIPTWMYELADVDIDFNGVVDIFDIVQLALAFGSKPGDPNWNVEADINLDGTIDIFDIVQIALKFGSQAPQWPLP